MGHQASARKTPAAGKLSPLNMRTTKVIREKLEAAAKANGRSVAAEVEERLLDTFRNRDEFFGSEWNYTFMRLLSIGIRAIERSVPGRERSWRNDSEVQKDVIRYVISQFRELGPQKPYTVAEGARFLDELRTLGADLQRAGERTDDVDSLIRRLDSAGWASTAKS